MSQAFIMDTPPNQVIAEEAAPEAPVFEDSQSCQTSSSSSSFSSAEFTFPVEFPSLFPYYATAGGSVFPNPSTSCSLSCAEEASLATASVDKIGQACLRCNDDEWETLQKVAAKVRLEVEHLQQQLAKYHPREELMAKPPEWRKYEDLLDQEESPAASLAIKITEGELQRQLRRLYDSRHPARVLDICHRWHSHCEKSPAFCHKVVLNNGIEALLDAMILQKDFPEVQEAICRVLGVLVFENHSHKEWLAESDGIAAILAAMKRFPKNADFQEAACGALHSFVYDHEPSQALVAQTGGVPLILAAMKHHRSDPGVQELGCAALTNMACHSNVGILKSIVHCGGLDVVVAAMRQHSTDEGVQEAGCAALGNLVYHEHAPCGGLFQTQQTSEIRAAIAAMEQHQSNAGIQEQACRALQAIGHRHEANKIGMAEYGAPMTICRAMRRHSSDTDVLEAAADALSTLSHNQDLNKTLTSEADGIFAILSAMSNHPSNLDLLLSCCKCLSNLTLHHSDNQRLLALSGGIPIILKAMNSTETVQHVGLQRQALFLLDTLLRLPENRLAFSNIGGREIITRAMVANQSRTCYQRQSFAVLERFLLDASSHRLRPLSDGPSPEQLKSKQQRNSCKATANVVRCCALEQEVGFDGVPLEIEFARVPDQALSLNHTSRWVMA